MLLYWDEVLQGEDDQLETRLRRLRREQRVVFAVAAATHALETFLERVATRYLEAREYYERLPMPKLFAEFWNGYPDSLKKQQLTRLSKRQLAALPKTDEDEDEQLVGEQELLTSAHFAFTSGDRRKLRTGETSDPVHNALRAARDGYYAVLYCEFWEDELVFGINAKPLERSSKVCLAEIEFQKKLLEMMEHLSDVPPGYEEIVSALSTG